MAFSRVRLMLAGFLVLIAIDVVSLGREQRDGLVVYSSISEVEAVAAAVRKRTGRHLRIVQLSTGSLLARVSAEGHHPRWDVIWFQGDTAAAALDQAGLLARNITPKLRWNDTARHFISSDGAWMPTGLSVSNALLYPKRLSGQAPRQWRDFLRVPRGTIICMVDAGSSGFGYPWLAGMLDSGGGWPQGKGLLLALREAGLRICSPSPEQALLSGQADYAITSSGSAIAFVAAHPGYAWSYPSPSYFNPGMMAVAPGLAPDKLAAARDLLRFVDSPEGLRVRAGSGKPDGLIWSVTTGVQPPLPGLPPLGTVFWRTVDAASWGKRQAEVLDWYNGVFSGQ